MACLVVPFPVDGAMADERSDREAVRQKKAAAAASVDGLRAHDDQLEAAVATLDANVRTQKARLVDADVAVAAAEQEVERLNASIAERERELAKLEDDVRRRAVELYMKPSGRYDQTSVLLEAKTSSEAVRKQALVSTADGSGADAMDRYRSMKAALEDEKTRAKDAVAEAGRKRDVQARQVREVEGALTAQQKAKRDLDARIASFQKEVDGLAAEEGRLTTIIRQHEEQAAQRAREEQARRDAEQAAAARAAAAPAPTAAAATTGAPSSAASRTTGQPATGTGPAPTPQPPPSGGGGGGRRVIWPTAGTVTSEYGTRWGRLHAGIDISAPSGTPIVAGASGTVISAGWGGGYGNLVVLDHGGGFTTAYAHQSRMAVSAGQTVSQGQVIGYVGTTGSSTGDHLHFECRINGSAQNPRNFL